MTTQSKPTIIPYQLLFDENNNLYIPALSAIEQTAKLALQRDANIGNLPIISFTNSGQFTIDPTTANCFNVTLTGDSSLLITNTLSTAPITMLLRLIQNAAGNNKMFWPVNVRWALNTPPVLNLLPNAVCLIGLNYDPYSDVWDGIVQSGGNGGGSGGSSTYTFNQSVAAATWVINHTLNTYPDVIVMDSSGNEIEADIQYVGLNQVVINFSPPVSGKAFLK